jgi:hypothetical protein
MQNAAANRVNTEPLSEDYQQVLRSPLEGGLALDNIIFNHFFTIDEKHNVNCLPGFGKEVWYTFFGTTKCKTKFWQGMQNRILK